MGRLIFIFSLIIASFSTFARENAEHPSHLHRRQILSPPKTFVTGVPVAFFDADSTLRVSKSGMPWATTDHDFIILPGVVEKLRSLNDQGYFVAIVSNQGRIPYSIELSEADNALYALVEELRKQGVVVNYFDFADKVDENRKPNIGMFQRLDGILASTWHQHIDLEHSMMVGDAGYTKKDQKPQSIRGYDFSNADRLFAENAHIRFIYATDFFDWSKYGIHRIHNRFEAQIIHRRMLKTCRAELAQPGLASGNPQSNLGN